MYIFIHSLINLKSNKVPQSLGCLWFWQLLGDWHFWVFHGVAENIVGSLLFCGVSIVQCLLNKLLYFTSPLMKHFNFYRKNPFI